MSRSGSVLVVAAVITGLSGCTAGSSAPAKTNGAPPVQASSRPAETGHPVAPADRAAVAAAYRLFGIGDEGSFTWRCHGRATDVTFVVATATDTAQVRVGSTLVLNRTLQPGQQLMLAMEPGTTSHWKVTQATEPRTLSATASITTRPDRCLVYLPPQVRARLKTVTHSAA
jgi:hypothetical protein